MIVIQSIDSKQVRKQWKVIVSLSDGEVLQLDPDAFATFHLQAGDRLDESTRKALFVEDLKKRGMHQALRWLAVRPQASGELKRKLAQKGFSEVADELIDKLHEQRYLDDEDFCRRYVKTRLLTKSIGSRALELELRSKGIDAEIIRYVLSETMNADKLLVLAMKAASKKLAGLKKFEPAARKEKLYRFLTQRGFDRDTIVRALNDLEITG